MIIFWSVLTGEFLNEKHKVPQWIREKMDPPIRPSFRTTVLALGVILTWCRLPWVFENWMNINCSQYLVFKESNMLYHLLEVHFKSHGGWVEVVNVIHGFSVHDYSKRRGTGFANRIWWAGNFRGLPRVNHPALVQHNWCRNLSKFRRWSFGQNWWQECMRGWWRAIRKQTIYNKNLRYVDDNGSLWTCSDI